MYKKGPLLKILTEKQKKNLNPNLKAAIAESDGKNPIKRLKYCSGKSKSFKRKKY